MQRTLTRIGSTLLLAAGLAATPALAADAVRAFSPQGTVKDVRQVAVRFAEPMVRLGDPRGPAPFDIACDAPGKGRWTDDRNWVYDFDADLPAGLRCRFSLSAGITSLAGKPLTGKREFSFDTGGPSVRASMPYDGSEAIDSEQVFLLALDAPATRASIEAQGYCSVANLAERLPLKVIDGQERDTLLAQRRLLGYSYYRLLWKDGEEAIGQIKHDALAAREANIVAARCARPLPEDAQVQLVWGRGIATASGAATADDQVLGFKTRPPFNARFECERVNAAAPCVPVLPMTLRFSASIPVEAAARIRLKGKGENRKPEKPGSDSNVVGQVEFAPPFPEGSEFTIELPPDLKDDAGRLLQNAGSFPLKVATDQAPPLAKFSNGEFGILEAAQGGVLPITLRDVEDTLPSLKLGGSARRIDDEAEVLRWMADVKNAMRGRWEGEVYIQPGVASVFDDTQPAERFEVTRPEGGKQFEVIGIPLKQPGFYVVELASPRLGAALLGKPQPRYVATTALVTNLSVHFKWGRQGSLVFVTTLDGARPVAAAELRIVDGCNGSAIWTGRTDDKGIARIESGLPKPESWSSCSSEDSHPLMVSARKDGDFAFALSSWNEGIGPYDFNLNTAFWDQPTLGHTVLDRTLFRAGETVSMKHFWREHTANGIAVPAARPTKLKLDHLGSGQSVELPLSFDDKGIAETEWAIPKEARLGEYQLRMTDDKDEHSSSSGSFRVEQYRVPLMRAVIQAPPEPAVAVKELPLDLFVGYFSGGGAGGLPVKLRTQLRPRSVEFKGYERFSFDGEPVKTGIEEGGGSGYFADDSEDAPGDVPTPGQTLPVTLDVNGAARSTVQDIAPASTAQMLVAELEYPDANGELANVRSTTPLWPAALALGIATDGWAGSRDKLKFQVVALDLKGKPLKNQRIDVALYQKKSHSYRKRLVGGFYAYSHSTETTKLKADCSGRSDANGLLPCELKPGASGEIVIEASAKDEAGRVARAVSSAWIAGSDEWWFAQNDSDRMDVVPEQREIEPGQNLRLQVRSPFRHATALVTIEREGVIDAFVTDISGKEPVIEVPMQAGYAPNVFVSVLALRPRVSDFRSRFYDFLRLLRLDRWLQLDGGSPTALIDLSKPAYRLGITAVDVGWTGHRLNVVVKPRQDSYKTRSVASVDVQVTPAGGGAMPKDAEIAFSAVDEALLDLLPNRTVDLLDAMMQRRGIEVVTSTAQMQVVGKRHYGRKSMAPGGGGGRGAARELLNSLLLWKGRVPLDAQGRATVDVPLNDALTAFRMTAVASAGTDRFGTGSASLRTTQDVQLLAGLPPLVREGDRYAAVYTVRNTTAKDMEVEIDAEVIAEGLANAAPIKQTLKLTLPANGAAPASFDFTAPVGATRLTWTTTAETAGGETLDALKTAQEVIPVHPVRVWQATLTQLAPSIEIPVQAPPDTLPGRGGLRVNLQASLARANLDSVREWMQAYPYTCYEQLTSKAVATRDESLWQAQMARLPTYLDGDGLVKYFSSPWLQGSDTLTAYVLALANEAGWEIPEAERERMLDGLGAFVEGRVQRDQPLSVSVQNERKLAALDALSRYDRAKPEWLAKLSPDANLWHTSALIDFINVLKRVDDVADRDARLEQAQQILRSRLNFQGTSMGFSTEQDDALWWLMISADVNAARAVLAVLDDAAWREDLPRMLRGSIGRQQRGHWNLTTANAWGALALEKFAAEFESETVAGTTSASLAANKLSHAWSSKPDDAVPPLDLAWPAAADVLKLDHQGKGAPWAIVQSRAAIPLREPFSSGYKLQRTVTAVEQKRPGAWTRGDVARVKLEVEAQSDMTWVVVDDPIPGGSTILGSGLGRDSQMLTQGERNKGDAWPAYEERRFDGFRAYYAFVPKGKFTVEYSVRYNNTGRFELPATHVEAMYAPEMLGDWPNAAVEVAAP